MSDNNHTMRQILWIIEYGFAEPTAENGADKGFNHSSYYFTYKQAEAQRVAVLNAMGVHGTKSKVPVDAQGECTFGEVLVMDRAVGLRYTLKPSRALSLPMVKASMFAAMRNEKPMRRQKVSTHRLFVRCPWCLEDQPIGRIHQHIGSKLCKAKMAAVYAA